MWDAWCVYPSLSASTVQTSPVKVLATPKWKNSDIRVVTVHDLNIILYIMDFCLLDPFTVLSNVLLMHFPYFGFFGRQRIEKFYALSSCYSNLHSKERIAASRRAEILPKSASMVVCFFKPMTLLFTSPQKI